MSAKEIAKFFSGFAANQVLTHGAMAASGTRCSVFGMTYTPELNTAAVIIWLILFVLLVYYSWIRREKKVGGH